jgi:SulP family sulfate permease
MPLVTTGNLLTPTRGHLVRWWVANKPRSRSELRSEMVAGVPGAIGSVPDGMAASVLVGVNPVFGLYASFVGPIAGGISSSSRLMVVTTTSAAALAAGSAVSSVSAADRPGALFLLTLLAGIVMVLAGVFKLGRYTRFVSLSVMTGFLTGVAVNILFGQLADLTGSSPDRQTSVARGISVLLHPGDWHLPTLAYGLTSLVIVALMGRTRFRSYAALVALVVPTAALAVIGTMGVATVADGGDIPTGIPLPQLPSPGDFTLSVLWGALAVAAIVLVQGAGVGESAPNPDGSRTNMNQDFVAQGAGNIAAGLFHGQPVGGSVSQTALNMSAGARNRWAAVFSGIWMALILVAFSGAVGNVVMACLAGLLIYAAASSIRLGRITLVWQSGVNAVSALVVTFLATLYLPIAAAVGIGVVVSLLLQLNQDLVDLRVVELRRRPDGLFEEHALPLITPDRQVLVIDVYGSMLYAGARTLQNKLPDPSGATQPVVVLRLRGRVSLGATFAEVVADYAGRLDRVGGRLILAGVQSPALTKIERTLRTRADCAIEVFEASTVIGESTNLAIDAGVRWLAEHPSMIGDGVTPVERDNGAMPDEPSGMAPS